jgi:hypothetical protein
MSGNGVKWRRNRHAETRLYAERRDRRCPGWPEPGPVEEGLRGGDESREQGMQPPRASILVVVQVAWLPAALAPDSHHPSAPALSAQTPLDARRPLLIALLHGLLGFPYVAFSQASALPLIVAGYQSQDSDETPSSQSECVAAIATLISCPSHAELHPSVSRNRHPLTLAGWCCVNAASQICLVRPHEAGEVLTHRRAKTPVHVLC